MALYERKELSMRHVLKAAQAEYEKTERMVVENTRGSTDICWQSRGRLLCGSFRRDRAVL